MQNTFRLINNRLKNLEAMIKQNKYCIDNNIAVDTYKDSLIKAEKEYKELEKEYEEIKQYCVIKR